MSNLYNFEDLLTKGTLLPKYKIDVSSFQSQLSQPNENQTNTEQPVLEKQPDNKTKISGSNVNVNVKEKLKSFNISPIKTDNENVKRKLIRLKF